VRTGDLVRLDAETGVLELLVDEAELAARAPAQVVQPQFGWGRDLFAPFRAAVGPADQGASIFPGAAAPHG
jgi:phosphogluconate dehydratase